MSENMVVCPRSGRPNPILIRSWNIMRILMRC